jgi:hypothetical protein
MATTDCNGYNAGGSCLGPCSAKDLLANSQGPLASCINGGAPFPSTRQRLSHTR